MFSYISLQLLVISYLFFRRIFITLDEIGVGDAVSVTLRVNYCEDFSKVKNCPCLAELGAISPIVFPLWKIEPR